MRLATFSNEWFLRLQDHLNYYYPVSANVTCMEEGALMTLLLYITVDVPYKEREWLYPMLPAIWYVPSNLVSNLADMGPLVHAREPNPQVTDLTPISGIVSASHHDGAMYYAKNFCIDPLIVPLNPVHTLCIDIRSAVQYMQNTCPYQTVKDAAHRFESCSTNEKRLRQEAEVIVKYTDGLFGTGTILQRTTTN